MAGIPPEAQGPSKAHMTPDRSEEIAEHARDAAEQRAGEEAFAAAAGERVEVTWGDELFQPVKFNGVRVGPFTASTAVRAGESIAAATVRLHREIAAAAQTIFEEKSATYLRNLAQIASDASKVQVP